MSINSNKTPKFKEKINAIDLSRYIWFFNRFSKANPKNHKQLLELIGNYA